MSETHPNATPIQQPYLSANVIEVEGVWKKFSNTSLGARRDLYSNSVRSFFGISQKQIALRDDEFWAVQDVSFSLARGKTLGVLGLNGAGKTTLLNMIGGMMTPDRGRITGVGAVGALMNLAAGLQPALSARENIFVGGAVRGWNKIETLEKFDEIVAFAELSEHLDRRLVDFSAGMRMRLAFSIAIHMNPDLLLVDEVLAVGDHAFREKCKERLQTMTRNTSVIIVSHSVRDIRDYCDCALLLRDGQQAFFGDVEEGLALLLESYHDGAIQSSRVNARQDQAQKNTIYLVTSAIDDVVCSVAPRKSRKADVSIAFTSQRKCSQISIGVAVHSSGDPQLIAGTSTNASNAMMDTEPMEQVVAKLELDLTCLNPGKYEFRAVIAEADEILYDAVIGEVELPETGELVWGMLNLPNKWQVKTLKSDDILK